MAKILLNKNNFFYNLDIISKQAGGKEKIAVVLKDNAYGHGLIEMANLSKEFGIKKAVVKNLDEALKIEKLFDEILILSQKEFHTYSHTFHISLNTMENISFLPKNANVHIKIDTGMHRNGISPNELEECIHRLSKKNINIKGIFTHHRNADEMGTDFFWQNDVFLSLKKETFSICEKLLLDVPSFHSCNSHALFRHSNFTEDFARVGIASYGYFTFDRNFDFPQLKPVLSLWAKKIATRKIKKNQSLGYGLGYKAKEDMIVSTYDLGYGDGFLRLNENTPYKTPKGFEILGRVSMDNLSLNTDEKEVCIFDDVQNLAKIHHTIPYEILTSLKADIPRQIV